MFLPEKERRIREVIQMKEPQVVHQHVCVLGEGPFWDPVTRKLWFIDGLSEFGKGDTLHCLDTTSNELSSYPIGKHIGNIVLCEDGRILMALQDGVYYFDPENGSFEEISAIEREISNNRLNDGRLDCRNRYWFGSMSMTANQPEREFEYTGSLYCMDRSGNIRTVLTGVGISNGIAWNAAHTRMYYSDTPTGTVFSFDYDEETGEISNRNAAIVFSPGEGEPDGMTIDTEDMVWVAHFGGGKVSRWNPETGERLAEIILPCSQVTCCTFAGDNLDELYITTATIGLSQQERLATPDAGKLFMVKPGVRGYLAQRYPNKQ